MENDSQTFEKALTSKDIAAMIGIAESTVRKYAAALEDAGYPFTKDGDGEKAARIFTTADAMVIRHLKELREKTQIPVDQASQLIAAKHPKHSSTLQVAAFDATVDKADIEAIVNVIHERHEERYSALELKVDALLEFNKALLERLDERDKAIQQLTDIVTSHKEIATVGASRQEERERERDAQVTQLLREIQETKQLVGRSVWKRMFGK